MLPVVHTNQKPHLTLTQLELFCGQFLLVASNVSTFLIGNCYQEYLKSVGFEIFESFYASYLLCFADTVTALSYILDLCLWQCKYNLTLQFAIEELYDFHSVSHNL